MSFIASLLTYKLYEKENWTHSLKAGLWVFLGTFILKLVPFIPKDWTFSAIITFGLVWMLASGEISFLKQYQTKKPIMTALIATIISVVLWLFVMTFILAVIGATFLSAMVGGL